MRGLDVRRLGLRDELSIVEDEPADVYVYGRYALVGSGCPRCLARRWQAVRHADLRDALELGGDTRAAGEWPSATPFVADALRALVAARPADPRWVYQLDTQTLGIRRFPVIRDADCPQCTRTVDDRVELARPVLEPAPRHHVDAFRLRPLDAYPLDVEAYANPVCGALGASLWQDITSLSTAPVIGAFTLRAGPYLRETLYGGHSDNYRDSARIGVLEGLERAAGLRPRGKRPTVRGTLAEFGSSALDPRDCGLYAEAFYTANPYVHRFSRDRSIEWVWGWSLRDERPVLVPLILVYYHASTVDERFVQETSNGCASGGSLVEAVYHGLMETIERDAFLLTWYGRRPLPELDPATSTRARTRCMVDRLAMYGYTARFFDTRTTFRVPVVTGVAVRRDGGLGTLAFGGGASLDPEAAIAAALCEIATDSVMVRVRASADEPRLRAMVDDFSKVLGLHDHPLLYGLPEMAHHASFLLDQPTPPRPLTELYRATPPVSHDLRDDLEQCVKDVVSKGFDVLVVDQTLPEQRDLGVHTVSVLVPGLLPIDFGMLRQRAPHLPRLRTAFREAGLRDRDLTDDEINPAPHPFP